MDYDEDTLNSVPTMGPDGVRRSRIDVDEPSLGSAPTMGPGRDASTVSSSSLGQIDQYALVRKLGGGGFGVVYLAQDTVSGVDVALKTLHPLLKSNPEEMEALRAKFALVSRLTHQNIAKALGLHLCSTFNITDDEVRREMQLSSGDFVMVMDFAPGVTLSKWRKQFSDGVVPLDLALEVTRQIASALDYAHGEKIVHRDIKPANVMVETLPEEVSQPSQVQSSEFKVQSSGESSLGTRHSSLVTSKIRIRILDFGLAAEIRSSMSRISAETGNTSGTRPYMAPEQWLGRKQDGRTDQYALACVLYEMLSGAPPFGGVFELGDPVIMERAVTARAPEEIEGFPAHVNAALMRALAKDPEKRFASCMAFVSKCFEKSSPRPRGWASLLAIGFVVICVVAFVQHRKVQEAKAERARIALEQEEAGRRAKEKAEARRVAREKAEAERRAKEEAEARRVAREKAEAERRAKEEAEARRVAREKAEAERRAKEEAEVQRVAREKAEAERRAKEDSKPVPEVDPLSPEIDNLKVEAARQLSSVRDWRDIDDAFFRERFSEMDRQKGRLDGFGKVSELSAAKAAAKSIDESANWIKANGAAFKEAAVLEADIATLAVALKAVDADKYAQGSLTSCLAAQVTARRLRDTGDFTGARDKFAEVKDLSKQTLQEASEAKRQTEEAEQAESFYTRGNDYYSGRNGYRQDYAEAVRWYRKAAEQGYAKAQGSLGWMYEQGLGIPKDEAEAVKWYRKAADQGNAVAQRFLGRMYEEGRGVPKDDTEAVWWYRKAANQGNALAQGCLGWMYEQGFGVPKDVAEAVKWYRMAADQGNEEAMKALRRLGAAK